MGSSATPSCADAPCDRLLRAVAACLQSASGAGVLLGLSGGMDSMVLLDVLAQLVPELRFSLRAMYVNHGLSPKADAWGDFCAAVCRERGVPFITEKVDLAPRMKHGLEGAARQARYEALARHGSDFIVVAQHRDDQAETLLLQLMRGAGAGGLGAMQVTRNMAGTQAKLLRPLLGIARCDLRAYALARGLRWVEDESNSDLHFKRNFLRNRVLPPMEEGFPGVRAAIARSAANLAEAGTLLDQLADEDFARLETRGGISAAGLASLGESRARNLLRRWCKRCGLPWPGVARLRELLRQISAAGGSAVIDVTLADWSFRLYRGIVHLEPGHAGVNRKFCRTWNGESEVLLEECGGILRFEPWQGRGISAALISGHEVTLRLRQGSERLQPECARPTRTLKNLLQEQGIPPWRRATLPLIYCGTELIAVPGIGTDCRWQAGKDEPGVVVSWESRLAAGQRTD